MKKIKKILITTKKNYFVRDLDKDYHSEIGFFTKEDLQKATGTRIKSNKGMEATVLDPFFIDKYHKIKRGAQIISRKDIGIILAETGINKKSKVMDAGSGSGALCLYLAHIAKKVYSYEIREDFFKLVKKNIEFLEIKNLVLKNADVYEGIKEKDLDLIVLDLPEPWKAIEHAESALKVGGFLVSYSPCIPQVSDFIEALSSGFNVLKTIEISEREWEFKGRKIRPKTRQLGHTGFITFARKV